MNQHLQNVIKFIEQDNHLSQEDKTLLLKQLKDVNKELEISLFKLDRTEKVKRTTAILLEETIDELEQKRKAIEETNEALQKSLEELKAAQQLLIQAEKMASLGELTAGIAHEIQNPLNFVNNFSEVSSELIEEMNEELNNNNIEEAREIAKDVKLNLQKITHHGKRADTIVKGMLQHSRTSTAQKELTDINALVDEYIRLCYHGLRAKDKSFNAAIITDYDDNLPKIEVISQDIGRVILNLLTNAFYAVNEKKKLEIGNFEPKVSVMTLQSKSSGITSVNIIIKDNGNGIPQNNIDKIFQPFFTTKPTGQGTGLGLSLSYDIIKAHGGLIHVSSDKENGTTFKIELRQS